MVRIREQHVHVEFARIGSAQVPPQLRLHAATLHAGRGGIVARHLPLADADDGGLVMGDDGFQILRCDHSLGVVHRHEHVGELDRREVEAQKDPVPHLNIHGIRRHRHREWV